MSRSKVLTTICVVLLTAPVLVALGNANATHDPVPDAAGIDWSAQVGHATRLYLNHLNVSAPATGTTLGGVESRTPDCSATTTGKLGLYPMPEVREDTGRGCTYTVTTTDGTDGQQRLFTSAPVTRSFTVAPKDAVTYVHDGPVPANVNVSVFVHSVKDGAQEQLIVNGSFVGGEGSRFTVPLSRDTAFMVEAGWSIRLTLKAAIIPDGTTPAGAAAWTVNDSASHLVVRSSDSHRAATWTEDPQGNVKSLFKPYPNKTETPPEGIPRFVGFFAVQSAFGRDDASGMTAVSPPAFLLVGNGVSQAIPSKFNDTASPVSEGVAVWNFETPFDYRGLPAGEYNLTVRMDYHQGGGYVEGTVARILVSAPSVSLGPYDDNDAAPSLETLAHNLAPGGQTTYLLLVKNTGASADTYRLSTALVSGTPVGWGISLGGPTLADSSVRLEAGEAALVTATVQSPASSTVGASSIFQINAQSALDPAGKPQTVTVISTVSNDVVSGVGVIVPLKPIKVVPGEDTRVSVYAWNRGTRAANISLEANSTGWSEGFVQADGVVKRVTLNGVQPGAIARVELRVVAPSNQAETEYSSRLDAALANTGGAPVTAFVRFATSPLASVQIRYLDSVRGVSHFVETSGTPDPGVNPGVNPGETPAGPAPSCKDQDPTPVCEDNGLDGTWFRAWITNTGRRTDDFDLSIQSPKFPVNRNPSGGSAVCEDTFFAPHAPGTGADDFGIVWRDSAGKGHSASRVTLLPGQTAEVYVWRPVDRAQNLCMTPDGASNFSFVLVATGNQTKARAQAFMVAQGIDDDADRRAVLLEGVQRLDDTTPQSVPLVDLRDVDKRIVTQTLRPGKNATFYARATVATSFANYTDSNNNFHHNDVTLTIHDVNREEGWNASMRFVTADPNEPFTDTLTLYSSYAGQREGFVDREVEIRVTPPDGVNHSALAGEQDEFYLRAVFGDSAGSIHTLALRPIIGDHAEVSVTADETRIFAHANEPAPILLYAKNGGSAETRVTVKAKMDPVGTANPNAWIVEPATSTFPLQAFKDRTLALAVRPPAGAGVGTTGLVNVTIEYAPDPSNPDKVETTYLKTPTTVEVAAAGSLRLVATQSDAIVAPGGFANFTLTLTHAGGGSGNVDFRLASTPLPNWTQQIAPSAGTIAPGESRTVVYVLKAPLDVVNESSFSTIVRVVDAGNDANFATVPLHVGILGGRAIPALSLPVGTKTVDRNDAKGFDLLVKNVGSASGRIVLSTRTADAAWSASILTPTGTPVSFVDLAPNDAVLLNVSVRAPLFVPEHTIVPIDVIAETGLQSDRVSLQAVVHDYGVHVELAPSRIDVIAGLPTEWTVKIRNDGNDNDTLNLSAILTDLPDWSVALPLDRLLLEPGQVGEIRAIVKPDPSKPLPIPRAYALKFYASTMGGAMVKMDKNETVAGTINVLNYHAADVDKDERLEIAVDADKDAANGFERFVEIYADGAQSSVVAYGKVGGKTTFFLDTPEDGAPDGVADVWFNPENVYVYEIPTSSDVNGDNAPDYLVDADHDGKVDKAFDTVSQSFWSVTEVRSYGDDKVQYLVDTTGDGKADRFFDPASKVVTRTQSVAGENNLLGLDTNNDQRVDKYYDIRANTVQDANVSSFLDFVREYWYFFVVFLAMVVLTIVLVARRRRVE